MNVTNIDNYRRRRKPKRSFKIPTPVIYFIVLIVGLYFFMHSPFFSIKNIHINGNELLKAEKILSLSQVEYGQNLIEIDKADIEQRISIHPLVKSVEVKRKLPNTLQITVVERKPIGLLVCPDGFIQVSEEGYFLALIQDLGKYNLPVISGITLEQLPGPGKIIDNEGLVIALDIIQKSEPEMLKNIVEFNVANENQILAYTLEGIEIRLGGTDNIGDKLNDLNHILQELVNKKIDEEAIEYIDLRFSGPPIIKKKY